MSKLPEETGSTGLELIKNCEGLSLRIYHDPVGLKTIGYGHLIKPDEDFGHGIKIEEAEDL